MVWKSNVLVVANVTATSDQLLQALQSRAQREQTSFMLVIPATAFGGGRSAAVQMLADAIERLRRAGLEVDGHVGAADPVIAVTEAWDPTRYDEIMVSTLPMRVSKWLHAGLPERIAKLTGARVTHVVSEPPKPAVQTVPAPERENRGVMMGPLSVLGWGPNKQQ
jgi:hypothetical protein